MNSDIWLESIVFPNFVDNNKQAISQTEGKVIKKIFANKAKNKRIFLDIDQLVLDMALKEEEINTIQQVIDDCHGRVSKSIIKQEIFDNDSDASYKAFYLSLLNTLPPSLISATLASSPTSLITPPPQVLHTDNYTIVSVPSNIVPTPD